MSVCPDELFTVLDSLKPALKSIDARTLAVKLGDSWQNLVTSVYVTEKSVDEVRKEHSKLIKLRNNQIVLLSKAGQFDYEIFGEIQRGLVTYPTEFGRNEVHFRNFDPLMLKVRSTTERIDETLKYVFFASDSDKFEEREMLWHIIDGQQGEAKRHGCSDMYDLIRRRLKISYNNREQKDFEVRIPSLAKIERMFFENSKVNVEMKTVAGLPNLQLNIKQVRVGEGGFQDEIWSDCRRIWEVTDSDCVYTAVTESFQIDDLIPGDTLSGELIDVKSGLTWDRNDADAPLKNVVEPFLKTVDAFCPLDKFQKMLFEPEKNWKDPSKVFEIAVSWLLSLAGFNVVYLGSIINKIKGSESFDVLRTETGYEIGCADIIAYEESKYLFLLDCDIGPLDNKKMQKMVETAKHISSKIKFNLPEVIPVLVTLQNEVEAQEDSMNELQGGLRIIGREKLKIIFDSLARGDRKSARDEFYNWW